MHISNIFHTFAPENSLMALNIAMNQNFLLLSDATVIFVFLTQFIILVGVAVLLVMAIRFNNQFHKRKVHGNITENEETKKWSADIRTKLINSIEQGNYKDLSYLDELEELTNFDGAVPALSVIEVNIVELIMSYRREILHETRLGVTVRIHTGMSAHSRATLDTVVFRQLIMNLLRISANRTKSGRIIINYEWEGEGLRFKIEDTGSALPANIYPLLFTDKLNEDMIINLDKKITVSNLKLCKSIVEAWQGTIEALPGTNNMGLIFSFWIPCRIRVS